MNSTQQKTYSRILAVATGAQLLFEAGVLVALSPMAARLLPEVAVGAPGADIFGEDFSQFSGQGSLLFTQNLGDIRCSVTLADCDGLCMATLTPVEQELSPSTLLAVGDSMRRQMATLLAVTPKLLRTLDESDEETMAWAAQISRSHYALMRLSGNLQAFAADAFQLHTSRMDFDLWLRDHLRIWTSLTQAAGQRLEYHGSDTPCVCGLDSERMERALLNILSNAIKFSAAGSTISLLLRRRRDRVTLTIRDQGCGISEDQMATVFCRSAHYTTLHDPRSGPGMGLAIAKHIVEAHGGRLMLESQTQQGTAVHISLPFQQESGDRCLASEVRLPDYAGGIDHTVLELSDALPYQVFDSRGMD